MRTLHVDLGDRSYPIFIGQNLLSETDICASYVKGQQVLIVSNMTVAPIYLERVQALFSSFDTQTVVLPDGEIYKNLTVLNQIFDSLLNNRFERSATLVALGGGVIGDMTGFAAACYQRGVHFIQIPTTLLAQVDSSVGGKTGVNHELGKNMIGAFFQPKCVLADTDTLNTLDDRQLSAGIAEVIKYGLIRDYEFFVWLEENMDALLARDSEALAYAIQRSCENKAEIVAQDEKESGVRATLNLGHTFGHAIESGMGYGNWLHGEAVGVGMIMAADLSARMGWIGSDIVQRIDNIVDRAQLPTRAPADMDYTTFMKFMSVDKKVEAGAIRFVLLKAIGESIVTSDYDTSSLEETINEHHAIKEY